MDNWYPPHGVLNYANDRAHNLFARWSANTRKAEEDQVSWMSKEQISELKARFLACDDAIRDVLANGMNGGAE